MTPFRKGRVHVCARECATCVFRSGNLMSLNPGRLRRMVDEAVANESAITCHSTLYDQHPHGAAVCRGFYDRYSTTPLRLAEKLRLITWQEPCEGS